MVGRFCNKGEFNVMSPGSGRQGLMFPLTEYVKQRCLMTVRHLETTVTSVRPTCSTLNKPYCSTAGTASSASNANTILLVVAIQYVDSLLVQGSLSENDLFSLCFQLLY